MKIVDKWKIIDYNVFSRLILEEICYIYNKNDGEFSVHTIVM